MKEKGTIIFLLFFALLFSSQNAEASDSRFTIKIQQPENQYNPAVSYFDLLVSPGQEQTLKLTVENKSTEDIPILLFADSARTTSTGIVDYSNKEQVNTTDDSLFIDLKDILIFEQQEYLLPKQSVIEILIHLKMPETAFEGVLAGGIRVAEANGTEETEQSNLAITNHVAYEIAVLIREKEIVQKKKLNFITTEIVDQQLMVELQNPAATFLNDISIQTKILNSKTKEQLFSAEAEQLQMAPNTSFSLSAMELPALDSGTYLVKITVDSEKNSWTFEDQLTISKEEAATAKKKEVPSSTKELNLGLWLIITLSLIILGTLFFILLSRQKRLKRENEDLQRKLKKKKKQKKNG